MAKNVVLCCDGTANEFATDHTNVLKLFRVLDNGSQRQVAFYHPGLGTMEAAGALTSCARKVTKVLGQAIGYGLERDIGDAYMFIMRHYEPGDALYLFGFSRGAYTVRSVAALLYLFGLLPRGNEPMIPYTIRMMSAVRSKGIAATLQLADDFRSTFRGDECKPHFVGVWDTVSSVGWIENPLRLPYTTNNPDIAIGRHAVAIDERRAFFRTNLWRPDPPAPDGGPKDLRQVWFPGVHCDVGGGYPEPESGLSKFAFEWMVSEAALAGLLVDRARVDEVMGRTSAQFAKADADAKMHESLTLKWLAGEIVPKRHFNWQTRQEERQMNLGRPRTMPATPFVHASAFLRSNYSVPANAVRVETSPW